MILRRVIEHFRKQEWTAIVLDFVIVVLGVLLAFQITAWNERRATRKQSADFSERLIADLEVEAWLYAYLVEYYDDVLASADRALSILEGDRNGGDEELLVSAYRATQFTQNDRRRATFDEIKSAGAIGLINDPALRDAAMTVYSATLFDEIYQTVSLTPYRALFRSEIPSSVQDTLAEKCGDKIVRTHNYETIVDALDYPCETGLPAETISAAANVIRQNEDFLRRLRLHRTNLWTQVDLLTRWYTDIRDALQLYRRTEQ